MHTFDVSYRISSKLPVRKVALHARSAANKAYAPGLGWSWEEGGCERDYLLKVVNVETGATKYFILNDHG